MRYTLFGAVMAASIAAMMTMASRASAQEKAPVVADDGTSDHDKMEGRIGIGYAGVSEVPFPGGRIAAPVISARYWMDTQMGVELGLGLATTGGTVESDTGSDSAKGDKNGAFAVMVHGGVPFSLYSAEHYSFQLIPELNIGVAQQEIKAEGDGDNTKNSGRRIDLGARAGAEIHFGFIGAPELTLTGSVGLFYTNQMVKTETGDASLTDTNVGLATTAFNNPWDFFTGNVAARYYF